jgi:hypothetical protein
LASKATL